MGYYIYESHMGGLYSTNEALDYEDRHCEQCGDSDWEVGYAENINEAWELLKDKTDLFDSRKCIGCPHEEDYDYCDNHCEEFAKSGGYSLSYVMSFLLETFEPMDKLHYVYLLARHQEDKDFVCVKVNVRGYEFGEKHQILSNACIDGKYVKMMVGSLFMDIEGNSSDLKEIFNEEQDDKFVHVYECVVTKNEFSNDNWKEAAWNNDGDWFGFNKKSEIDLLDDEKWLEKYL